ncbi:MAG: HAMP domain-containing histidine kinase [Cyanobacteria bacterium SIG30]|nr:HAMP domain-containing histidine kinase [Cyanobacteria bacterium SIG30]
MNNDKKIIDDFISTLSHEIRTPLTSIKGFAQTMNDNYDLLSDEQKKKFLSIIQEQSQRLINLVENVLSVTKIESQTSGIILKEVNLKKIIEDTVEMVKINYKNRDFIFSYGSNLPTSLSDYDKLQQILVNIIENACKYSPSDSVIKISIKNTEKENIIEIQDNGDGIEKELIEKIFDKFYRVGNLLTNKAQGSGLGLYIAKTLADKIGAKIEVESLTDKNNHYTKFIIKVPVFEMEDIAKRAILKEKEF